MWSELSVQPRFSRFREKIIHLVVDDASEAPVEMMKGSIWALETLQERLRWEKIVEWNMVTRRLKGNDVIGFGDADEVTSRHNIQLLKHCPLRSKSLDIGIWFPYGRMDQAFMSDYPVSDTYRYTLGINVEQMLSQDVSSDQQYACSLYT